MAEKLTRGEAMLLDSLAALNALESIGRQYYRRSGGKLISPALTSDDLRHFRDLADEYGMNLPPDEPFGPLSDFTFNRRITETEAIAEHFDISMAIQPKYIGNAPHVHDYFEITCVCRGKIKHIIGGETLEMEQGDICILTPGVMHDIVSVHDDNVVPVIHLRRSTFDRTFFRILSEDDVLGEYFHKVISGDSAAEYILFRTGEDWDITRIILDMSWESQHPRDYTKQYLDTQLAMLFLRLLRDHYRSLTVGGENSASRNTEPLLILQHIKSNFATATLAATAEMFHYNSAYLSRMLKQTFGRSFTEIRSEIRLTKARQLLLETDMPVDRVSESVGYEGLSHFHREFKKRFGFSPGEYRRKTINQQ